MIPVVPAPEPESFDARVRQRGLRAIAELVGERPPRRDGKPLKQVADSREDIPADKFPPYWRCAIDDLLESYHRICAYLCFFIPRGSGAPSVDHLVPKSTQWDQVYEWSNYRLACAEINARKGVHPVLDPFEIKDDWFALELVGYQVMPGDGLPCDVDADVRRTIDRLALNREKYCDQRSEYADDYHNGDISHDYLKRHAPFVARELERQGRLRPDGA